MRWDWLKNAMPRTLYGRAALILVLPVVLLQLLVSVVFIQRHFEGVTQSMTRGVALELELLVDTVEMAPDLKAARGALSMLAAPLRIETELPALSVPSRDINPVLDFTGGTVIARLRQELPEVIAISLQDRRRMVAFVETRHGPLKLDVPRGRVSASNPHQLLVIMVVLGGLMTVVAYLFLRNQLRPIKRMAAAATDYGRGRITPFSPAGAVEVRAAGMAFLDMRNRLERQVQSRTMMLSGVSHDLRTPITRLKLGLSLLDEKDAAPLLEDVAEMQALVDSFLDFARGDAGDAVERVVPQEIVRRLLEDARRAGQPVEVSEIEGEEALVALRPLALRRALDNLISNALRYGSRALVGVSVTDKAIRFVVEDDGPGIPPEAREDAVNPFVRLDPSRNQDKGSGVGLGLAIVSDVARVHGGTLRLGESETLGGLKAEIVLAR